MRVELIVALLALPLFPLSMPVNAALQALPAALRAVALLALPAGGALLLAAVPVPGGAMAQGVGALAALTALLYAWRLLAVREVFIWARLQATSAWPLVWMAWLSGMDARRLVAVAVALTLPAAALTAVAFALRRRLGAAYLGLQGRIGPAYPRLTGVWVGALLATLAVPPFPGFFALLGVLHRVGPALAAVALGVWLLWGWAAAALWQHALFGAAQPRAAGTSDLSRGAVAVWVLFALAGVAAGLIGGWGWWMR